MIARQIGQRVVGLSAGDGRRACLVSVKALNICNVNLTAREREIVDLLRADPLLDAAALAERIGSTRAAVSVHLSNLTRKGVVLGRGYIVRPEADSVVVVGGAVLDTKVRTAGRPGARHEQPGHRLGDGRGSGPQHRREPGPPGPAHGARGRRRRRPRRRHRAPAHRRRGRRVPARRRLAAPHRHLRRRARRQRRPAHRGRRHARHRRARRGRPRRRADPARRAPTPWSSTRTSTRPSSAGCSRPRRTPGCARCSSRSASRRRRPPRRCSTGRCACTRVTPNVDELAALVGHPVADTVDDRAGRRRPPARPRRRARLGARAAPAAACCRRPGRRMPGRGPCSSAPPRWRSPTSPARATR